jgi:hypothetical protein
MRLDRQTGRQAGRQTERQTDITQQIVAFRDFAEAPKNRRSNGVATLLLTCVRNVLDLIVGQDMNCHDFSLAKWHVAGLLTASFNKLPHTICVDRGSAGAE